MRLLPLLVVFAGFISIAATADAQKASAPSAESDEFAIRIAAADKTRTALREQLGYGAFAEARENALILEALSGPVGEFGAEVDKALREDIERITSKSPEMQERCKQAFQLRDEATQERIGGRHAHSLELLLRAEDLLENAIGSDAVFVSEVHSEIGYSLHMCGEHESVRPFMDSSLDSMKTRFGKEHGEYIAASSDWAEHLLYLDQDAGLKMLRDIADITRKRSKKDVNWKVAIDCRLAAAYLHAGQFDKARELTNGVEPYVVQGGPCSRLRHEFLVDMSRLALGEKNLDQSQKYFEEAQITPGQIPPTYSVDNIVIVSHEAKLYDSLGLRDRAEVASRRVKEIQARLDREREKAKSLLKARQEKKK